MRTSTPRRYFTSETDEPLVAESLSSVRADPAVASRWTRMCAALDAAHEVDVLNRQRVSGEPVCPPPKWESIPTSELPWSVQHMMQAHLRMPLGGVTKLYPLYFSDLVDVEALGVCRRAAWGGLTVIWRGGPPGRVLDEFQTFRLLLVDAAEAKENTRLLDASRAGNKAGLDMTRLPRGVYGLLPIGAVPTREERLRVSVEQFTGETFEWFEPPPEQESLHREAKRARSPVD